MGNPLIGNDMKALLLQFLPQNYEERDASLDWARIIAAFLVIYGHLYSPELKDPVRVFIYQFHMPFFFLISGMLHKYRGRIQLLKYCKTILVPFLLFQVISYLFNGVFYHYGWLGLQHECQSDNLLTTLENYFVFACKQFYVSPCFW
jgi:fucose 4-O-acetylase-like acetyltransferase